jgi:hypothetical protein
VDEPRGQDADLAVHRLQRRKKLPDSEVAESAAALELGDVQGHNEAGGSVAVGGGRSLGPR